MDETGNRKAVTLTALYGLSGILMAAAGTIYRSNTSNPHLVYLPGAQTFYGAPEDGIGLRLSVTPVSHERPQLSRNSKVLVAALGSCASCSINAFKPGMELPNRYDAVILLVNDDPAKVRQRFGHLRPPYFAVCDAKGALHKKLRADFTPRFYEADSKLKIVRSQTGDPSRDGFLIESARGNFK